MYVFNFFLQKETKETFLESLLNLSQQWYQDRDRVLKNGPSSGASPSPRFCAFMQFLNEMYCEVFIYLVHDINLLII